MPWYLGNSRDFFMAGRWWGAGFIFPLVIWSLFWSGLALWYAARRVEKWWFILFLLIHTVGILEILYLLFVVRILDQKKSSRRRRK